MKFNETQLNPSQKRNISANNIDSLNLLSYKTDKDLKILSLLASIFIYKKVKNIFSFNWQNALRCKFNPIFYIISNLKCLLNLSEFDQI